MNDSFLSANFLRSHGPDPTYEIVWNGTPASTWGRYLNATIRALPPPLPVTEVPQRVHRQIWHGQPVRPVPVLAILQAAHRPLTKGQIAKAAHVSRERVEEAVDRLVASGGVTKTPGPKGGSLYEVTG